MIRWRKVRAVMSFEFNSTVKRVGYLVATLAMPLLFLLWGGIPALAGYFMHQKENETRVFGVVDHAGVLKLAGDTSAGMPMPPLPEAAQAAIAASGRGKQVEQALKQAGAVFRPVASENEARAQFRSGTIRGWFVVPEDYIASGRIDSYVKDGGPFETGEVWPRFRELLSERVVDGRLPREIAARAKQPIADERRFKINAAGEVAPRKKGEDIGRVLIPLGVAMLMFISLTSAAGYLLQAVATEKENRVVEVLLASADPDEILAGKLFGLGAAGLLQMFAWFGMAGVAGLSFAGMLAAYGVAIPWGAMALAFAFFLAGYFFMGSLMLGLGSLGSTQRESQQWSLIVTLPSVFPMMMFGVLLADPNGVLAQVLSWIPITAPLTVLMRLTVDPDGVPGWQIAGSLGVMVVSTFLAINVGARLFRVGLLLTGTRPKIRQILRQAGLLPGKA